MNIGQRIKLQRIKLGIKAEELGELIGKDRATVFRYENREIRDLPSSVIMPLADALKMAPEELLGSEIYSSTPTLIRRLESDSEFLQAVEILNGMSDGKLKEFICKN